MYLHITLIMFFSFILYGKGFYECSSCIEIYMYALFEFNVIYHKQLLKATEEKAQDMEEKVKIAEKNLQMLLTIKQKIEICII